MFILSHNLGTGKTTCIAFRLIASYLLCKTPSYNNVFHKRQIFITASPMLRHRVKKYFVKLQESIELARKKITKAQFREYLEKKRNGVSEIVMHEEMDEEQELKEIPNSFNDKRLTFPLFITFDKFS